MTVISAPTVYHRFIAHDLEQQAGFEDSELMGKEQSETEMQRTGETSFNIHIEIQ